MDTLQSIVIGAIGYAIGSKIQRYLENKIKSKWLCWILSLITTLIIIIIPVLVIRYLILGNNVSSSSAI
jgi:uncharacterized membrane protein YsdA (DUF1294 family)